MKKKYISISSFFGIAASAILLNSGDASAVTFTGYDENTTNPLVPLTTANTPNSNSKAAFDNFSAHLNGSTLVTESFENIPTTTYIDGLSTTIAGTVANFSYTKKLGGASANGGDTTKVQRKAASGANKGFTNSGTYPTDGSQGISINSENNFSISFSNTLAAFGYFGTDLGDNNNILTMKFFNNSTLVNSMSIPVFANSFNSSEYFFGFIADSLSQQFNRVEFISSISNDGDAIGIDQIKIATPAQLTTQIPEPSSLLGTLFFGGSMMLIKRRYQRSKSKIDL
jgi:hypothetical protein